MIALKFALAVPAIALLAVGAIDLRAVAADRATYQTVAEAAALAGARELGMAVDSDAPAARAEAWAQAQLAELTGTPRAQVKANVIELPTRQRAIKVSVTGRRMSFFGNLLPPGGWRIEADATAASVSTMPLCVLAHSPEAGPVLRMKNTAKVDAPGCLIHSNADIRVDLLAKMTTGAAQAVGRTQGSILKAAHSGAPPMDDPYIDLDFSPPVACPSNPPKTEVTSDTTLQPGVHCGDYQVAGSAQLTLAPGEHWFVDGLLTMKGASRLVAQDAVLIFDRAAFAFAGNARVNLRGREQGRFAGFVIVGLAPPGGSWCGVPAPPPPPGGGGLLGGLVGGVAGLLGDVVGDVLALVDLDACTNATGSLFVMASDNVDVLEGVVYTPASMFVVSGKNRVAEAADWTVMIVRKLQIVGSPTLVINADYGASPVPVPDGVGDRVGALRLID